MLSPFSFIFVDNDCLFAHNHTLSLKFVSVKLSLSFYSPKTSFKTPSPHSAILGFLFQFLWSSIYFRPPNSPSSSSRHFFSNIFLTIRCFRRQFLRNMWPILLPFLLLLYVSMGLEMLLNLEGWIFLRSRAKHKERSLPMPQFDPKAIYRDFYGPNNESSLAFSTINSIFLPSVSILTIFPVHSRFLGGNEQSMYWQPQLQVA
jgi:hypothetical protein